MTKQILLLTIFAVPTLFGASSSNNNQTAQKSSFELLAQDFKNAINEAANSSKVLELHKQLRKTYKQETEQLTGSLEFKKLILDRLKQSDQSIQKHKPTSLLELFIPQSPIWKKLRQISRDELQQEYDQEQERRKEEREANLKKLIKEQQAQETLKKAENDFLSQIALYEYASDKNTACNDIINAYQSLSKINNKYAQKLINNSDQFATFFDSLRTDEGLQYLQLLKTVYSHNQKYVQDAKTRKTDKPQNMVLFDDVNNTQNNDLHNDDDDIALNTAIHKSLATQQDNERFQIALAMSKQTQYQQGSSSSNNSSQLSEQEQIEQAKQLSQQQFNTSTVSNLDNAKLMAQALIESKQNAGEIIHIQNTITQIMNGVDASKLSNDEQELLTAYIQQICNNNNNDNDSEDDDQLEPQQNNNTYSIIGGAVATSIAAGILYLLKK